MCRIKPSCTLKISITTEPLLVGNSGGVVKLPIASTTPPEYPKNNGSVVMEVFKVQDGLIRHIGAFVRGNGQLHSGWSD